MCKNDFINLAATDQSAASNGAFIPVERELVFDIDLTDYDDVRSCGKEGHICNKCWPLMAVAVQVKQLCSLRLKETTFYFLLCIVRSSPLFNPKVISSLISSHGNVF